MKKFLLLFVCLCSLYKNANAQTITINRNLSFGKLLKPIAGTNWLQITASSSNPETTGTATVIGSTSPQTASITVTSSKANQEYAITLPSSITLTNNYNNEIIIDNLVHNYGTGNGHTTPKKTDTFYIGGRINLSNDIQGGSFSGTINIQIDFL